MAKITIEFDDATGMKVEQSQPAASSASIDDAEGGAALGASSESDAPAIGRFDRFADDAVNAGGPPEWLLQSMAGASGAPNFPSESVDDAADGGSAPEA